MRLSCRCKPTSGQGNGDTWNLTTRQQLDHLGKGVDEANHVAGRACIQEMLGAKAGPRCRRGSCEGRLQQAQAKRRLEMLDLEPNLAASLAPANHLALYI